VRPCPLLVCRPGREGAEEFFTTADVLPCALESDVVSDFYPVKTAVVFTAVMLIAVSRVRAHHPFNRFGPANRVTMVRLLLVSLVAGAIGEAADANVAAIAVVAATVATMLDGADGWLARRTRMESTFGARFDVEVDALLIQVLAVLAWRWQKAGPWVLLSGFLRYAFIASGWFWPWMRRPLAPTFRAKAICILQTATLIIALMPYVRPPASAALAALALGGLGYSFLADSRRLWAQRLEA
jgi:phosphatidylglycerophosphate synthase